MTQAATFNSPLEAGIRAVNILECAHPQAYDLQRLVTFDYLVVHTGEIGGPVSLHPKLPLSQTEILVRRRLIEDGILLMMSHSLIERIVDGNGITYRAGNLATTFVSSITAPYLKTLHNRSTWVTEEFGPMNDKALKETMKEYFDAWIEQFQAVQHSLGI